MDKIELKKPNMTRQEWYDHCMSRGTSGDQVFSILEDWRRSDALYTERAEENCQKSCEQVNECSGADCYPQTKEEWNGESRDGNGVISQPVLPVEPDLMLTDERINTVEMPCDEDTRTCPVNSSYSYDPISIQCQLCSHRMTAKAQLKACQDYYQPLLAIEQEQVKQLNLMIVEMLDSTEKEREQHYAILTANEAKIKELENLIKTNLPIFEEGVRIDEREKLKDRCGAYAESWEHLGKPKGWLGCSLPKGHTGDHKDED